MMLFITSENRSHHHTTHTETQVARGGTRGDRQGPAVRGSPQIISGGLVGLLHGEERGPLRRHVVGGGGRRGRYGRGETLFSSATRL